jgi:putative ABC transport system permease protein
MFNDLIYAVRNMTRNPGLSTAVVLTLSLGIGLNAAMFGIIDAVLLRPLPYREPGRLVTILARIPSLRLEGAFVEYNTFAEFWRAQSRSFEAMWASTPAQVNLTSGGEPERLLMNRVNAGFLSMIGTRTALGREFLPDEDLPGAPRVAILSDALWKRRFSSDSSVIGRSVVLDNNTYTIVGVLPPDFDFYPREVDIYAPIAASTARTPTEPTVGVHARLKPGVTIASAQAEIDWLCRRFAQQYPYPKDWGARVWPLHEFRVRGVRQSFLVLAAAVAIVLLIACANVANLLLARASARRREMAVRSALGARRSRIVRQLLTENAMFGVLGGAFGLLFAWAAIRSLPATLVQLPATRPIGIDLRVLCFTFAAASITTLLFGLAPALATVEGGLAESLKDGGRSGESLRRSRFREVLIVVEVALALMLVIGATLTVRSLQHIAAVDPGFNPGGVLTASISLPAVSYDKEQSRVAFFKALLQRLEAAPGVKSASMVSDLPFSYSKSGADVSVEGEPLPSGTQVIAFGRSIDPKYFATLQVRLLKGRRFSAQDTAGAPIAIVNETMARRYWPHRDPIGKRFRLGRGAWIGVVGVTADMRQNSLSEEPDAEYYMPHAQSPSPSMGLVLRADSDPLRLAPALRAAVRELDTSLPVSDIAVLSDSVDASTSTQRLSTTLFGLFALLALLLATVGIYGVISYSTSRRTREIGLRLALGAERRRISAMVVGRAAFLGGVGVAAGLAGGLLLSRLLGSMLYGVSATDPTAFVGAAVFLLALAVLAGYIPARRAARVDPVILLRNE